jgi:hypothetical protein
MNPIAPSHLKPPEPVVPGGVYLCQVNESVSCGACCGLYNRPDATRGHLQELLGYRTETFRQVARNIDAIDAFRLEMERREQCARPYVDFYACPFLGLIGPDCSRPGCLLHPLADENSGIDYRGLSFYGGLACRDYFCPTYRNLPAVHKEIVKTVCTDWYLYGLVITEERLLAAMFGQIENRLSRPLAPADISVSRRARDALRELFGAKLAWPYHGPGWQGPGNYFFNDGLYLPAPIDYDRLGARPSAHDGILRELSSVFESAAQLAQAETLIENLITRVLSGVAAPRAGSAIELDGPPVL